jgi:hypothetical protein
LLDFNVLATASFGCFECRFKSDPPAAAGWRFEIESQIVAVERLLDACPDIETARFRLVPRVMKEGRFFSNLFFGIELIRQSALNDLATEEEPALSAAAAATDHGENDQDTEDLRYADASEEVASKPALPAAAAAVAAERVQAAPGAAAASLSEGDRQPRAGASFRRLGVADAPPPRPQTDLLSDAALAESMAGSAASGLADDGTAPLSATGRAGAAAWDSVAQREGGGSGDDTLDAALEAYIGRATDEALGGQHEQDATPAAEVAAALGDLDDEQISSVSSASPSAGAAVAEDDGEDADVGELELSAAEMEDLLDGEEDAGEVDAELEAAIAAELEADMG